MGTTASGGTIVTTGPSTAVIDTFPSGDAKAVLETVPEPLAAGQRVPPPRLPAGHPGITPVASGESRTPEPAGAEAGEDSPRAEEEESEAGDVPVPSPTRPLGDRPRPAAADTTRPAASPAPAAPSPAPSAAPGAPAAPAAADTCWRVQVAAVPEPERAEALRSAAQSQLLVSWVIEKEKGLHKVRTKGCYGATSAEGLRRRAVDAGFAGAFKFLNPAR